MDIEMRALVADRVGALQKLAVPEIKALPAQQQVNALVSGKFKVVQYHDVDKTGEHLVVVQALRQRWFGILTEIEVDGFALTSDGVRRQLTEEEKWSFK